MPIKITTNLTSISNLTKRVRKAFNREIADGVLGKQIIESIRELIQKGISPVEGYGRFQRYSQSYRTAIKERRVPPKTKVSPVNLTKSGAMLKSLVALDKGGKLILQFENEVASYHQKGTRYLPIRKLFPTGNERFSNRVTQKIKLALRRAVRKSK